MYGGVLSCTKCGVTAKNEIIDLNNVCLGVLVTHMPMGVSISKDIIKAGARSLTRGVNGPTSECTKQMQPLAKTLKARSRI